ncbi:MAG: N-acetylglucosamine-6-phosphate deacetylase [Clostridia bacterium]|nr:N-acetylglucosamine-6-phosphate deacetylase [Clostridia bacterium]
MKLFHAEIYDARVMAFRKGSLTLDPATGKITSVNYGDESGAQEANDVDMQGALLAPGLVDVHTHGRNGFDFNTATSDQMREMAKGYLAHGVTTVMPTLASAPMEKLAESSEDIVHLKSEGSGGARFAGVHLEGRYLNPSKRGAHAPELLVKPTGEEIAKLLPHMSTPCHISAALELDEDGSFMDTALKAGATLGLSHTASTCAQAMDIYRRGHVSFTHTYNCMTPLHHREGGTVCAALLTDAYVELICDGMHICPDVVAMTYKVKGSERLVLITDSMEATGCGDGHYNIAGMPVVVKDGKALTLEGNLAGSTLELCDGLRNLMQFAGISLEKALPCATINPARMIGVDGLCGSLEEGKYADILVLKKSDKNGFTMESIYLGGQKIQ